MSGGAGRARPRLRALSAPGGVPRRSGGGASRAGSMPRFPASARPRARLLIVGLAPGLQGANRTGRPFTGDHAGVLLYDTLEPLRVCQAAPMRRGPTTGSSSSMPASPMRCAACRRRTSRPAPRSPPAAASSRARSPRCRICAPSSRSAASPTTPRSPHSGRAGPRRRSATAPPMRSAGCDCSTVIIARATTRTPGVLTTEMFHSVFAHGAHVPAGLALAARPAEARQS